MINWELLQLIGLFDTLIWLYLSLTELLLINSDIFCAIGVDWCFNLIRFKFDWIIVD